MFCKNCGSKQKNDSKFCPGCGQSTSGPHKYKMIKSAQTITKPSKASLVLDQVVHVVGIIVGFVIGRFLGLVVVLFLFAYLLGAWFPGWYFKRGKINNSFIKWISWSNVLSWILPPLGILTGFATLGFSNLVRTDGKKYKILAIVGIGLALLNAISGMMINL